MSMARSPQQNRYAFGVVIKALMAHCEANGSPLPKEEVKRLALIAVGHCQIKEVFGDQEVVPKPTRTLDVQEFEELLESIRAWAAGKGITINLPGEGLHYPVWP